MAQPFPPDPDDDTYRLAWGLLAFDQVRRRLSRGAGADDDSRARLELARDDHDAPWSPSPAGEEDSDGR